MVFEKNDEYGNIEKNDEYANDEYANNGVVRLSVGNEEKTID